MIRFDWEEERRKIERVDDIGRIDSGIGKGVPQVCDIMADDIVSADVFHFSQKPAELCYGSQVKNSPIAFDAAYIKNLPTPKAELLYL